MRPSTLHLSILTLGLLLLPAALPCSSAAEPVQVAPNGVMLPIPIPDCHPGGIVSRLRITGCDTIEDLDVSLEVAHPWTGDLVITLESPSGTRAILVDRPGYDGSGGSGCDQAGLAVYLDDQAAQSVEDQCADDSGGTVPAISGDLVPANPLSIFDGELGSGIWTLRVSDWAEENSGTLVNWQLHTTCTDLDIDLQSALAADRDWARPGDTVVFTLRLANSGQDWASGVKVHYTLPSGLQVLWAEPGALAERNTISQRFGVMAPGQVVDAQFAVLIAAGQQGRLRVEARAIADQTDSLAEDNLAGASIQVGPGSAGSPLVSNGLHGTGLEN